MLVRMKIDMSGTINGDQWPAKGGTIDLPDSVALKLVTAGQGEAVADRDADVETTDNPTPVELRDDDPTPGGADPLEGLRADLEAAGVKVDKRWGEQRLRDELDAATTPEADEGG